MQTVGHAPPGVSPSAHFQMPLSHDAWPYGPEQPAALNAQHVGAVPSQEGTGCAPPSSTQFVGHTPPGVSPPAHCQAPFSHVAWPKGPSQPLAFVAQQVGAAPLQELSSPTLCTLPVHAPTSAPAIPTQIAQPAMAPNLEELIVPFLQA
jgi:hypothetical protein